MEWKRFALAMMGHFLASLLYVLRRLRLINAVVDTSSILEHREEIRELWEKRMMADDNQSSLSSTTVEPAITKPALEESKEEVVVTTNSESETKSEQKLPNGFAKAMDGSSTEDDNANHIQEDGPTDVRATVQNTVVDNESNNNCEDSLEEIKDDDYVEEKTYTSETSLVMNAETTTEVLTQSTTIEEIKVSENLEEKEVESDGNAISSTEADGVDLKAPVEEPVTSTTPSVDQVAQVDESNAVAHAEAEVGTPDASAESSQEAAHKEANDAPCIKALEIPDCADDDGFVRIEECLPIGDSIVQDDEQEIFTEEQKNGVANGHEEQHPGTPSLPPTPDSALGEKLPPAAPSPEIEQFVKSGGLKRVLVQKTEQPYSTCTTETKIAMEIREMREREEELRVMREQAPVSPVPPPPKSPSPSPVKEVVPNGGGCGYRVSSVFGHKSPSVVAQEERNKGFAKESAVEKEIRLARDREEELRRQKGLPPREDDSYVKPSQVKSSQVRVFGKVAGGNNVKQAATAKIQLEIEEQTQRELALRDTGSIQTISQERTDAKVAKLNTPEVHKPVNGQNGNSHPATNGNHATDRSSPDYRRGTTPGQNGVSTPATIFAQTNGKSNGISMHKFIASKGKESTFTAPVTRNNGSPFKEEAARIVAAPPNMIKLKRTVSVESKIQQEIMEMKQREEELKLLHMNRSNGNSLMDEEIMENEINQKNNFLEYENGNGVHDEEISPRHNKLIAQWEQRIQKAES